VIFKELSILVVEQGTVLDRIDYNVSEARKQVVEGNK
jgi:t-SNARE complex subunit (syntaxin)